MILSSEFLFAPWREKSVESAILDPSFVPQLHTLGFFLLKKFWKIYELARPTPHDVVLKITLIFTLLYLIKNE